MKEIDPLRFHSEVEEMYSWSDVAERPERVYNAILKTEKLPLVERLRRF
jgi:phosphatidylinositol glycan class A protein